MQGKISSTRSIRKTLRYNELKVEKETAVCLHTENFLKDKEVLTVEDKQARFSQLMSLHESCHANVKHFFLNFHPEDQLTDDMLVKIAKQYIAVAGFEEQPYLVYRHFDAGHPHLHIVTTKVRADRTLIDTGPARLRELHVFSRAIEKEFNLKESRRPSEEEKKAFEVEHALQVQYGEGSLMKAVSDVLNTVIPHYKYTSLAELNAILGEYNVVAVRGREDSHLFQTRGLLYFVLNSEGQKVSRGIKASSFSLKPTLDSLEKRFIENQSLGEKQREHIETAIEWVLAGKAPNLEGFKQSLVREGISVVMQDGKGDKPGSVYFVDHRGKSAFSGERIGDQYALRRIQERLSVQEEQEEQIHRHRLRLHL